MSSVPDRRSVLKAGAGLAAGAGRAERHRAR
ncbi:MAG: twin-arginine translocation signal domain-containing protein [Trebonia sp.]